MISAGEFRDPQSYVQSGGMSKKKDKKAKAEPTANIVDYKAEVKRLQKENKDLRSRLEKISRMAFEKIRMITYPAWVIC